jgi:hypothetical protein
MDQAPGPTVSTLASVLSQREPEARTDQRLAVVRPGPWALALLAVGFALLLALPLAMILLGSGIRDLLSTAEHLRADRLHREREALPASAVLLDAAAWQRELVARPRAAAVVNQARCAALAEAGRWQEVVATIAQVSATSPGDLTAAARLIGSEALFRLGRLDEAVAALHTLDARQLDATDRQRAEDLAGRLWMAGALGIVPRDLPARPAAAAGAAPSVERSPEQPGQPASE